MVDQRRIKYYLDQIYGSGVSSGLMERVLSTLSNYTLGKNEETGPLLSERDSILITYPDQVRETSEPPLATLNAFCRDYLNGVVNGIHVLPFFPSSSDDGFSVIDYRRVDPDYGGWDHIKALGTRFRLMFDCVVNHVSAESAWFRSFLRGEPPYRDYFTIVDGNPDLSGVVRPRALPLLTRFDTATGERAVWTTFSADQVDLDYRNPDVLLEMIDILLYYVEQGASFIRLDAVAYLWKQIGTSCIHRPETHSIVRLMRAILDEVAPNVSLITETNVAHSENIGYFGSGEDEAHLVYNFALPPLVLHALHTGQEGTLSEWATGLRLPSTNVAFFNMLATHDGIGLNGARGILSENALEAIVDRVAAGGGRVSSCSNQDGTLSPYEMNVSYFDALADPQVEEDIDLAVRRFVTANAILLAMRGLPGIYFHSMFGSRGWAEGAEISGQLRTINRQKLELQSLAAELADPKSLRSRIYTRLKRLLESRSAVPAFAPGAEQRILRGHAGVFALVRGTVEAPQQVLCLSNLTAEDRSFPCTAWKVPAGSEFRVHDLISGERSTWGGTGRLTMKPYQSLWLKTEE